MPEGAWGLVFRERPGEEHGTARSTAGSIPAVEAGSWEAIEQESALDRPHEQASTATVAIAS